MLVPQTLATQLLDIFTRMRQATEMSDQQLANELADAIDIPISGRHRSILESLLLRLVAQRLRRGLRLVQARSHNFVLHLCNELF